MSNWKTQTEGTPREVMCMTCGATRGKPCRSRNGRRTGSHHNTRKIAWRRLTEAAAEARSSAKRRSNVN